ncbi:MAG: DegQ family serine endoprotease [Gammaproteobacteria bacterium]|nr:DegQ family serine endoprotease [Gammaproteobacteria bacterium]
MRRLTYISVLFLMFSAVSLLASAGLPAGAGSQALPSLAPVLERVTPAVVNISTQTITRGRQSPLLSDPFFRYFFDFPDRPRRERKSQSLGSGVVINAAEGYVVTNHHVIDKADKITVTLRDGRELKAELIGADPETDVALIKITAKRLTEVHMADSDALRVGDFVVAIGNPFGLGQTVTSGIVSALGRSGLGIEGYEDFIQTDASINPGNSGGALINLKGELVGINTAILAPSGGNIGIGFAIPTNMVKKVADHLVEFGEVKRGFLGIGIQDMDPDLAAAFGLQDKKGAAVVKVERGSSAARAGVLAGDIIVAVNGRAVNNSAALRNRIGLLRVGDQAVLSVVREGRSMKVTATVAGLPGVDGKKISPYLEGAKLREIDRRVLVQKVKEGSAAWNMGLRKGDVLLSINRISVENMDDLSALLKSRRRLLIKILRKDTVLTIWLR